MNERPQSRLSSPADQRGLTIVEIMVALAISLLLLVGVVQIFTGSKQAYRTQDALSRLQESGRFAVSFLTRDIRMADFWGCIDNSNVTNNLESGGAGYVDFADGGVAGADGTGLNGSDTLTLRSAYDAGLVVQTPYMPTASSALQVPNDNDLAVGDVLIVSDCLGGDIFQRTGPVPDPGALNHNTGAIAPPGNASNSLSKTYAGDATLYRAREVTYSIGAGASGEPALFRTSGPGGAAEELVEGVENMQVLYGEDTDGDRAADYYVAAGSVVDMDNVVSIRVALLLRSPQDNIAQDPQTYSFPPFPGTGTTTAADNRLRQVYAATIGIRNRM
ncbi:MAG: prepilin-type N-terminal cleavage/methylation domain-containing protein [Gammaproteobacteria bacterium]|nr:prepilin-type N-terminal cleavage/methylation domain-containing protein [Gammaproteobacteria bacterium]NIR98048.1 prepilin-type N-terminal cleavage/methylation domain-containing protein [Gammaproteobacteria bacterium]NIT63758.1 prepilin-type N-terminal cleavage/methylation domain-containing protein [Gammaproteobacteria bacterium]NIV20708.1 prepilin-type N-terminal cleavage/methylation domain-containing protein [Gammaproteobacteria bacterium]NIY32338.1 prepilin-type N-terminal cleavage/methyl